VVDRVGRGDLNESVVASGHVETPFRVEIGSRVTGTVDDVLVTEGQRVTKGQPLIALEARERSAAIASSTAASSAEQRTA